MSLPDRARTAAPIAVLMIAGLVAACGGATGTGASPAATDPPAQATATASQVPSSAAPSSASPSPSPSPSASPLSGVPDDLLTACLTLGPQDCERARAFAATTLAAGDLPVRYVQVGPFGCATGDRCPPTLLARPEGDVILEFGDGQGITVHLKVAPDGTFEATREPAMGVSVEPASVDGGETGPIQYSLGHCGIFSGIDLDGAWWDPVGSVAMDSGEAVNATPGVLTFTDKDHATFTTPTGFSLQLIRRDGPKLLALCM